VIACPRLLAEVERALRSPGLARWVDADQVLGAMRWIVGGSRVASDPETVVPLCRDPADDYLVALALREVATIVTGDRDLFVLRPSGIDVVTVGELAAAFGVSR
jgi:predicted nucleic acid-binding protein